MAALFGLVFLLVALVTGAILFGIICLPAVLALMFCLGMKSKDWREVRWALWATPWACLLLGLFSSTKFTSHPKDSGSSDGDIFALRAIFSAISSMEEMMSNYYICLTWVWGGGLAFVAVSLTVAVIVRFIRRSRSPSVPEDVEK